MTKSAGLLPLAFLIFIQAATAFEYPLHFIPNPGAQGLVVAGYTFTGDVVSGNCSYYTVHSGSGKGGGYRSTKTYYNQTCTWDQYGNLLTISAGAPAIPAPLYVNGTKTIYAMTSNGDSTGVDTKLPAGGFVNTPGSHYTWTTPNPYTVIQQMVYTFAATLTSDGDLPLNVTAAEATALTGKVSIKSDTCAGQIRVGASCSVTFVYDPTHIHSEATLAYDTVNINVTSDAGQTPAFVQSYTIVLTPQTDDNE